MGPTRIARGAGRRVRTLLAATALAGLAAGAAPPAAANTLYRFVDEDGVVHFSNVPSDPRYVAVRRLRSGASTSAAAWRPRNTRAYDTLIASAAEAQGLPPALVKAVIAAESNFNPRALSPKGAQGLMQLMPGTAAQLGVNDAFEARQNVHGGTRYLARMVARYGDWTRALAAYNAGPEAVERYGGVPPYRETQQYVKRVLDYYRRYHAEFGR